MERRTLLKGSLAGLSSLCLSRTLGNSILTSINAANQTVRFDPTWESLAQYQVPDWFRDAKFGMWAHWGPQCQPERLLGAPGNLTFSQSADGLKVNLADQVPGKIAHVLKIEGAIS